MLTRVSQQESKIKMAMNWKTIPLQREQVWSGKNNRLKLSSTALRSQIFLETLCIFAQNLNFFFISLHVQVGFEGFRTKKNVFLPSFCMHWNHNFSHALFTKRQFHEEPHAVKCFACSLRF